MLNIKIETLTDNISPQESLEIAYDEELNLVVEKLLQGISCIIKCEKKIIPYLQKILKNKLSDNGHGVCIIDGNLPNENQNTKINNMVFQIKEEISLADSSKVLILPYLDIITSIGTTKLSIPESTDLITIIYENPFVTMLAFEDPEFGLPEIIKQAFPSYIKMLGISREKLQKLITKNEAKKFASVELNINELYRYVSGLNPLRFREIISEFDKKPDFSESTKDNIKEYYTEIRKKTTSSYHKVSEIDINNDIAGYGKIKDKLKQDILQLLDKALNSSDEEYVKQIENLIPKGLIFYGAPGTGKTLFAKALAGSLNATIYTISASELKSKWIDEGDTNIHRLFARARATAPSVIIFEEFDLIASSRGFVSESEFGDSSHSIVNQILNEMSQLKKEELVFLIGLTNLSEALDTAFLRSGRFEYQLEINYPDWDDRKEILALYNKKLNTNLSDDGIELLTAWSSGITTTSTPYAGDHLHALMRDLKRSMINENADYSKLEDLNAWLKKQKTTLQLNNEEYAVIAIHEMGHTMLYHKYNRINEIQQVTIESGMTNALGFVELKKNKRQVFSESVLKSEIAVCLGGYASEKLLVGEVSSGAENDLYVATTIAESMVASYGMGNLKIPRSYIDEQGNVVQYYLNLLSPQIDALLFEVLAEANIYLSENRLLLEKGVELLLEKRTLKNQDLIALLGDNTQEEELQEEKLE